MIMSLCYGTAILHYTGLPVQIPVEVFTEGYRRSVLVSFMNKVCLFVCVCVCVCVCACVHVQNILYDNQVLL